jgi:hypothetical protein
MRLILIVDFLLLLLFDVHGFPPSDQDSMSGGISSGDPVVGSKRKNPIRPRPVRQHVSAYNMGVSGEQSLLRSSSFSVSEQSAFAPYHSGKIPFQIHGKLAHYSIRFTIHGLFSTKASAPEQQS